MQESKNKSTASYPSDVTILNGAFYDQYVALCCHASKAEIQFIKSKNHLVVCLNAVSLTSCLARLDAVSSGKTLYHRRFEGNYCLRDRVEL